MLTNERDKQDLHCSALPELRAALFDDPLVRDLIFFQFPKDCRRAILVLA